MTGAKTPGVARLQDKVGGPLAHGLAEVMPPFDNDAVQIPDDMLADAAAGSFVNPPCANSRLTSVALLEMLVAHAACSCPCGRISAWRAHTVGSSPPPAGVEARRTILSGSTWS